MDIITQLRNLIREADLETAISQMLDALEGNIINKNIYDEVTLHSASLNQNNREIRQGVISGDDARRTRARISFALLELISEMEKKDIPNTLTVPAPTPALNITKILFIGSNPTDDTRLRLDKEQREIDSNLRMSKGRDTVELIQRNAARPATLQDAILEEQPAIVHFSGHGLQQGIIMEDNNGNSQLVNTSALENLFSLFSDSIKCVLLNSCYSETQAQAIAKHIPYVIGMKSAVPDAAAIAFAVGFYKAIAAAKDIPFAFKIGVNAIQLEGISGDDIPQLLGKHL